MALIALSFAVAVAVGWGSVAHAASDTKPYDDRLLRLSEILGAVHYLRELCGANEGQYWRDRMRDLMDAEGSSALRRAPADARLQPRLPQLQPHLQYLQPLGADRHHPLSLRRLRAFRRSPQSLPLLTHENARRAHARRAASPVMRQQRCKTGFTVNCGGNDLSPEAMLGHNQGARSTGAG